MQLIFSFTPVVFQACLKSASRFKSDFIKLPIAITYKLRHQNLNLKSGSRIQSSQTRYFATATPRIRILSLYGREDEVKKWTCEKLIDWLQTNTMLTDSQLDAFREVGFEGASALNVEDFFELKKYVPNANFAAWEALLELRIALMIPSELRPITIPVSQVSEGGLEMPFVGRQEAVEEAWQNIYPRAGKSNISSENRLKNPRLFAAGTPGIGKTRFGLELPSLLIKKAQETSATDSTSHFILNRLTTNPLTIFINFFNGYGINATDKQWCTEFERSNWILTSRAIYNRYRIHEDYSVWANRFAVYMGKKLPERFYFSAYVKNLVEEFQPTAIYFHMDEFQMLLSFPSLAPDVFRIFSAQYAFFNSEKILTVVLYSGTLYSGVDNIFGDQRFGYTAAYPMVTLPLGSLSDDQVYQLLSQMKANGKLQWLPENWHKSIEYLKLFALSGGVPRLIELILDLASTNSLNNVADNLKGKVKARYQLDKDLLKLACIIALSGLSYKLDSKPFEHTHDIGKNMTVEELISNGSLFKDVRTNTFTVPYLYFSMAYSSVSDRQVDTTLKDLGSPHSSFKWLDFEKVSLIYDTLKIEALKALGHESIKLQQYFNLSLVRSKALDNMEIKLTGRTYVELAHHWPETHLSWPVARDSQQTAYNTIGSLVHNVFLNAAGSSFDGFMFAQATNGHLVLFAHQNKHTAEGKTELTFKEVKHEVQKMTNSFNAWLTGDKNQSPSSQTIGIITNPKVPFLHGITAQLVPIIFTNRVVSEDCQSNLTSFASANDLIVISNPAYFGPWQKMLQFTKNDK